MKNINELDTKTSKGTTDSRINIAQRMSETAKRLLEKVSKKFLTDQKNELNNSTTE